MLTRHPVAEDNGSCRKARIHTPRHNDERYEGLRPICLRNRYCGKEDLVSEEKHHRCRHNPGDFDLGQQEPYKEWGDQTAKGKGDLLNRR